MRRILPVIITCFVLAAPVFAQRGGGHGGGGGGMRGGGLAVEDSAGVDSAEASEGALTAALDSVDDSGSFRSTDFTAAMDTTIPSSTIPSPTIPILILILMPVRTPLPATVRADPA
jgi:hypothetical protein